METHGYINVHRWENSMANQTSPLRYPSRAVMIRLTKLLHLPPIEDGMQDWPLEVSDPKRLREFCDLYEIGRLDDEMQFTLMQLIVFSLDDTLHEELLEAEERGTLEKRAENLLRHDFPLHLHTINYWRCPEDEADPEPLPDNGFAVTPLMRRVWDDCFRPEYSRWLEENQAQ